MPIAEAHFFPVVHVLIPSLTSLALELVGGAKFLLGGSPDLIVTQPADFFAPKDAFQRWAASGSEQFQTACDSIYAFLSRWVIPFLAEVSAPKDIIRIYEENDTRVVKARHWYVFLIAAYRQAGQMDKARAVLAQRFKGDGVRQQYAPLFRSLGVD